MSYDVYIGGQCYDYTYNLSKLFYDHIPKNKDRGGLSEIDGLTGKQALSVLSGAFERMGDAVIRSENFCAKYDAPNGWGSTVGAILFLGRIMATCAENPRKRVRVH